MKQTGCRKLWNKRKLKTNGTNARTCIIYVYIRRNWRSVIRMSGYTKRFSAPPFRRCRSYCPVLKRAVAVSTLRPRINVISAYCLSCARERSCKNKYIRTNAPPWDRHRITIILLPWSYVHTLMRADYPLYPPDEIEMYHS